MRFIEESKDPTGVIDDNLFQQFLNDLPNLISRNPGAVWLIGNEPDRKVYQDDLTPEKYAKRFFEVATIIKNFDPNAKIGFGSVVQPTPIRIRYLERSLDSLASMAGSMENALEMIDIWTIHAFILNENYKPGSWGADVPPGFDCNYDCNDAYIIESYNYSQTYSIEIFKDRIIAFRNWMKTKGEQDKPLWITEYGSLFPAWEDAVCYGHQDDCSDPTYPNEEWPTTDDNIDFMLDTFNFLLYSSDVNIGLPEDDYKLVQRWFWYSLNYYVRIDSSRPSLGGSLFDPEKDKQITELGKAYKRYIEFLIFPKTFLPVIFK